MEPSNQTDLYDECIANGCSPKLAEMLASRSPPAASTDTRFMASQSVGGGQFADDPLYGSAVMERAKREGVNTSGAVYLSSLADSVGDPKAWVRGRGDIKRIASERNMSVNGTVTRKQTEVEPMKVIDVAPDILAREVKQAMKESPGKKKQTVIDEVKNRIVPHWKK